MNILHITHNDMDAVGCDVILGLLYPTEQIETHFCAIGTQDQTLTEALNNMMLLTEKAFKDDNELTVPLYDKIYVTDISISFETYDTIVEYKNFCKEKYHRTVEFVGVDHHISNQINEYAEDFDVISEKVDEITKEIIPVCATKLLYHMYKDYIPKAISTEDPINQRFKVEFEHFVNTVNKYDTWLWKNNTDVTEAENNHYQRECENLKIKCIMFEPDDFYPTICKKYGCHDLRFLILKNINNMIRGQRDSFIYPSEFITVYNVVKKHEADVMSRSSSYVRFITNGEYIVGMYFPNGEFINTVTDVLYEQYPFVDYWAIILPSVKEISFRSNKEDVNVSRIASRVYGGGGHKSASGAKHIDTNTYLRTLQMYYDVAVSAKDFKEYETNNKTQLEKEGYYKTIERLEGH